MEWTDESIARLRALWQEGLSTAEIGRRMQITKNAVVGKAHRLDLSARPSPIRKAEPQTAPQIGSQAGTAPARRPVADKSRMVTIAAAPQADPAEEIVVQTVARSEPDVVVAVEPVTVSPDPAIEMETMVSEPVADQEPVAAGHVSVPALPDNVRLLRPDVPNPAVASLAAPDMVPSDRAPSDRVPSDRAAPTRAAAEAREPAHVVSRVPEPREPRRRGLTCCWPLGEPGTKGFHFCGGDPTPGKPYCAEHAALAYVKLRDRRDSVA